MGYEQFYTQSNSTQFQAEQQMMLEGTASIYHLLMKVATWGIIFCLLIMAGTLGWANKDSMARNEWKKRITRIILVALIIFGLVDIFSLIQLIGEGLSNRRI